MRDKMAGHLTYSGRLLAGGFFWNSFEWVVSGRAWELSLKEQGAIRNLLDWYVMHGPLTKADDGLSRLCGDPAAWRSVRSAVMPLFVEQENGFVPGPALSPFMGRAFSAAAHRPHIPMDIRKAVFDRDGYACVLCRSEEALSLDHIVPFSLGGPDTERNLRVVCRPCNSRRGNRE